MDEEVDGRYICPICWEVLKNPMFLSRCQHRYCESCLQSLASSMTTSSGHCPICRQSFEPGEWTKDTALERDIHRTTVVCNGCGQRLQLLIFNSHTVNCAKRAQPRPPLVGNPRHPPPPNRQTFKCPYCTVANLTCAGLKEHVSVSHADASGPAVCPICASMPWGNSQQVSSNFVAHLTLRHRFEYDTYVDFEQDEEAAFQAILEASRYQY